MNNGVRSVSLFYVLLAYSKHINVCKGDSGGPLMCVGSKESIYEVCGIVSFGRTDCTRASEHSAFSRQAS